MLRLYTEEANVPDNAVQEIPAPEAQENAESDEVMKRRIETLCAMLRRKGYTTCASQLAPLHRYRKARVSPETRSALEYVLQQAERAVSIHDPREDIHLFNRNVRIIDDILTKRGALTHEERIATLEQFLQRAPKEGPTYRAIAVLLAEPKHGLKQNRRSAYTAPLSRSARSSSLRPLSKKIAWR